MFTISAGAPQPRKTLHPKGGGDTGTYGERSLGRVLSCPSLEKKSLLRKYFFFGSTCGPWSGAQKPSFEIMAILWRVLFQNTQDSAVQKKSGLSKIRFSTPKRAGNIFLMAASCSGANFTPKNTSYSKMTFSWFLDLLALFCRFEKCHFLAKNRDFFEIWL